MVPHLRCARATSGNHAKRNTNQPVQRTGGTRGASKVTGRRSQHPLNLPLGPASLTLPFPPAAAANPAASRTTAGAAGSATAAEPAARRRSTKQINSRTSRPRTISAGRFSSFLNAASCQLRPETLKAARGRPSSCVASQATDCENDCAKEAEGERGGLDPPTAWTTTRSSTN